MTEVAQRQAWQDALTGALNRRAFEEDLAQWQAQGQEFNLALLDIDGLRGVNDNEGHSQGDKLLRVFAETLTLELTAPSRLYRLGGDEFVVLTQAADAAALDEQIDIALLAARQMVAG